jgi:hypothetical protein
MATSISEAFHKGTLVSDNEIYSFVKLPTSMRAQSLQFLSKVSSSTRFQAFMLDKDEITVMVSTKDFEQCKSELGDQKNYEVGSIAYRLITFDVVLAPTLVGFMAVVTKALAANNVSVLPFAAYSRDHIFVAENDFETAMEALGNLKNEVES